MDIVSTTGILLQYRYIMQLQSLHSNPFYVFFAVHLFSVHTIKIFIQHYIPMDKRELLTIVCGLRLTIYPVSDAKNWIQTIQIEQLDIVQSVQFMILRIVHLA